MVGVTQALVAEEKSLNARQKEILTLLEKQDSISINAILQQLNNPPSQRMVRKDLDFLREKGLIELQGHARTALWCLKK